jgi:hypothetical protein
MKNVQALEEGILKTKKIFLIPILGCVFHNTMGEKNTIPVKELSDLGIVTDKMLPYPAETE